MRRGGGEFAQLFELFDARGEGNSGDLGRGRIGGDIEDFIGRERTERDPREYSQQQY